MWLLYVQKKNVPYLVFQQYFMHTSPMVIGIPDVLVSSPSCRDVGVNVTVTGVGLGCDIARAV